MICPLCPRVICQNTLSNHLKQCHGQSKWSNFKCKAEGCTRVFSSLDSFKHHVKKCDFVLNKGLGGNSTASHSGDSSSNFVSNEEIVDASDQPGAPNADATNYAQILHSLADKFVSKLYAKPNLPRNHIQQLVTDVTELISNSNKLLKDSILDTLKDCNIGSEKEAEIQKSFELFNNPFPHLSSEYRRLAYFTKSANYISPVSVEVGVKSVPKQTALGSVYAQKTCYVHSIPLRKVLQHFLEQPLAFESILEYVSSIEKSPNIENLMNCPVWKSKRAKFKDDDIVFPLLIYADDFECNNALGSHCKLLGAVYASLACLPPECQTAMKNIFLALLYQTVYLSDFGDKIIFSSLISELKFLQNNGIVISTASGKKRVFFVTALMLGDNKGLNSLCGFVSCFKANHFCRFCKTHRTKTYSQAVEDPSTIRDRKSYETDVTLNNYTLTGVKFDSAFNKIPNFHVTDNCVVDNFHDFAEGICHYVLLDLLKNYIPKYFTLEILNDRILFFDYGLCESNKIPKIGPGFVGREKLKMSGCETLLFVKVLGLLVGDLVPEGDPYWMLYLKMRELLDVCLCKSALKSHISVLRVLAEEFNLMYVSVTKDTLKPKMHHLVHYARCLEQCGPIDLMSTRKWESKHRSLTIPAHSTASRVDVTLTLSTRHQLTQCFQFLSNQSFLPEIEIGPCEIIDLSDLEEFDSFKSVLAPSLYSESVLCADWVEVKGSMYKPNMVLLVSANEIGPVFAQLKFIVVKEETVFFISNYLLNHGFNSHVHGYSVSTSSRWCCHLQGELFDPLPLYAFSDNHSNKYVILKCSL